MLTNIKYVYFLGIGGIGMSALARWFKSEGYWVGGYDRTETDLTRRLATEGMDIHYADSIDLIPPVVANSPLEQTLIVWTPAVPVSHPEYQYLHEKGYAIHKRAEVLGWLTQDYFTIAVAGTHGKTTTSSMIAHILYNSPLSCTAFLGGILQNYDSNLLLSKYQGRQQLMVVEADEYDKSFLRLSPTITVVTSLDADHLDIYGDVSQMLATYHAFMHQIKAEGRLFAKKGLDLHQQALKITSEDYAVGEMADYAAQNIRIEDGQFYFDWFNKQEKIENLTLRVPGYHNVENATVAIAVCRYLGVGESVIRESLASFSGAKRRFDYLYKSDKFVLIDDYAHHPTEVRAFLTSLRAMYPNRKITAIFQPHLYTRTRDFADDFAESLSLADELLLLEIYPARELPIEGITARIILEKVNIAHKQIISKSELLAKFAEDTSEIVATIGAGDISDLGAEILKVANINE
jgi:UDP-N-acetylmuramate--alanine ligase